MNEKYRRQLEWCKRNPERRALSKKKNYLKSMYGITLEDYTTLLTKQNGTCALCCSDKCGGRGKYFHVDHDHKTGIVRGLLCMQCNTSLGRFENNPELLNKTMKYLQY